MTTLSAALRTAIDGRWAHVRDEARAVDPGTTAHRPRS